MAYELFEHTADLGLRIRAAGLPELYAEAGRALFAAIVVNLSAVRPLQTVALQVAGSDPELLLFDWLTELLYVFESRKLLLAEFELSVDSRVEQTADGWQAEVIVDI